MELKEARYILAIARQGSIGKAAESLFISQPSLSKYLKNLENQLGGPLFYRRDNCYTPTDIFTMRSRLLLTGSSGTGSTRTSATGNTDVSI